MPRNDQSTMRVLQAAAYVVVVAWGIKAASHIFSVIFIALLLTYVILPFPKWLMRRFHFPKGLAIPLTVVSFAKSLSPYINRISSCLAQALRFGIAG